jgi:hypothetical protein
LFLIVERKGTLLHSSTLAQPKSKQQNKPYTLTPVDEDILKAVWFHHFMTAEQILRFRDRSINGLPKMQERLKLLFEAKYLDRFYKARYSPHGSLPFVYLLAGKGIQYLTALGIDSHLYYRPYKNLKRSPLDTAHDLALNDILIAAHHLEKHEPRMSLNEARHEWMLRSDTYRVTLNKQTPMQRTSEQVAFTPDGWLDFRLSVGNQKQQACVLVEMDMDTHQKPRFQKKIASYIEFVNAGLYEQHFHTSSVVIAFVTPTGEKRAMQMKAWAEEQLARTPVYSPQTTNGIEDSSLFLFAAVPPGTLQPLDVFLKPLWYAPFDNKAQPLLTLENR